MRQALSKFTKLAELIAAALIAAMFATFILQIFIRYTARIPAVGETLPFLAPDNYGWTLEFCLVLWVWLVFWGNAFIVKREDHVTFDMIYDIVQPGVRRWFLIFSGLVICFAAALAVEPSWAKFHVLRLKKTATLSSLFGDWIRVRHIYAIYVIFLAVIAFKFGAMAIANLKLHFTPGKHDDI